MNEQVNSVVTIKSVDNDRQIVYGVVYEPYTLDTYGEMMLPEDIESMAHEFMRLSALNETIDTNHDEVPNGSYPIESYIAKKDDPEYNEGAWVLGVKVEEPELWSKVKRGELNGFSFQAMVRKQLAVVEYLLEPEQVGVTEEQEGPNGVPHRHFFFVRLNDDGRVVYGRTSTDEGHAHEIYAGTATGMSYGHSHRIKL